MYLARLQVCELRGALRAALRARAQRVSHGFLRIPLPFCPDDGGRSPAYGRGMPGQPRGGRAQDAAGGRRAPVPGS